MNQYSLVIHYGLRTGDRIVRGNGVLTNHLGIYVGIHDGIPLVAENHSGTGVQYIPLGEFLRWSTTNLTRIEQFRGSEEDREAVIPQINHLIGKPYDLVRFNCEHFTELLQNGRVVNRELNRTMTGVGMFGLLVFLFAGKRAA